MNSPFKKDFIILIILYLLYVGTFWLAVDFDNFFDILNWEIFFKASLFLLPIYLLILWRVRHKLIPLDYRTVYIPFFFWIALNSIFGGHSGTNFLIVELPIVAILSGFYLLKIPLMSFFKIKRHLPITITLWAIICALITVIHYLLPALPE